MYSLPIAFSDDREPEEPVPSSSPSTSISALVSFVLVGFALMIFAQRFPPSFSILKGIFNFIGCLLSSPVLWLFFRAYHEIVPLIFVGQSSHSRPASESDPEFSLPVAA